MGSYSMASSPGSWIEGARGGKAASWSGHNKLTKGRGRMVVKPILKKLSTSEKNSLDLDRVWEEQPHWTETGSGAPSPAVGVSRSARDVTFLSDGGSAGPGVAATAGGASGTSGDGGVARPSLQHARSPSGTSHSSVATTSSNGPVGRSGSFVHPFQQTPRTATPPPSYSGSLDALNPSSGAGAGSALRDYSPTITENEDDDGTDSYALSLRRPPSLSRLAHSRSHSQSSPGAGAASNPYPHPPHSLSQSNLRRPSFASQRTSSYSDANGSSGSAVQSATGASRSAGAASAPRLVHGGSMLNSSKSQSDLHLGLTINTAVVTATTVSATAAEGANSPGSRPNFQHSTYNPSGRTNSVPSSSGANAPPASASSFGLTSPTSSFSATPMSPLRTSLEMVTNNLAPRLRSLSEQPDRTKTMVDPVEHARLMRERRAKFDERERLKNEKMAKKRGRAISKEAEKQQRQAARSLASSSSIDYLPRPSTAASTSYRSSLGGEWRHLYGEGAPGSFAIPMGYDAASSEHHHHHSEKGAFAGVGHAEGRGVGSGGQSPQSRLRGSLSAKRRTHGYWTSVILWIRTKIFKLSRAD